MQLLLIIDDHYIIIVIIIILLLFIVADDMKIKKKYDDQAKAESGRGKKFIAVSFLWNVAYKSTIISLNKFHIRIIYYILVEIVASYQQILLHKSIN